jgi:hypothetical protein
MKNALMKIRIALFAVAAMGAALFFFQTTDPISDRASQASTQSVAEREERLILEAVELLKQRYQIDIPSSREVSFRTLESGLVNVGFMLPIDPSRPTLRGLRDLGSVSFDPETWTPVHVLHP